MASSCLLVTNWRSNFIKAGGSCCLSNVSRFDGNRHRNRHLRNSDFRSPAAKCSAQKEEPLVLRVVVSGMTELLRLFSRESLRSPPAAVTVSTNVPEDLVEALRSDFAQSYFLTGEFTDILYAENCLFADPTVQFSGRDLYKRNLKLLVPFYEDPTLILDSIKEVVNDESKFVQAYWRLRMYLKLPWKPYIAIDGSTKYNIDAHSKIVQHVERWNVNGMQAFGQLLKPSERAFWKKPSPGSS